MFADIESLSADSLVVALTSIARSTPFVPIAPTERISAVP